MQSVGPKINSKAFCQLYYPRSFLAIKTFLILFILFMPQILQARVVKVGVYDNPPKVTMGSDNKPNGIFIDLIEYIAKQEKWEIEYVHGDWAAGLQRLENGDIDIMPDVAYSKERAQKYTFNQLAILSSWLQIFKKENTKLDSISDLNGKVVAVLKGGIQERVCNELRNRSGLDFKIVALPDYETTIQYVESGKADLILCGRFYGFKQKKKETLVPTTVILRPTTLHFVSVNGRNDDLIATIDMHLSEMMNDPNSMYYQSLVHWLHEIPKRFVPKVVKWLILTISCMLFLAFTLNLFLRWKVKQRTHELWKKNIDLQNALNELKFARNEALKRERLHAFGQLASGVAHDFNNILVPILGYTELMLEYPKELEDKENLKKGLTVIKNAADRGVEIVERMKQFWRLSEQEEKVMVLLSDAVNEVVDLAKTKWKGRPLSGSKPVEVDIQIDNTINILARRYELHELLLNLALNAADAMPEGGTISIHAEKTNGNVKITVNDTGVGMTDDEKSKCLEPFFTTKGADGTGMGLNVVSSIVSEYGGKIEILSEKGKGASFIIELPIQR